MRRLWRAAVVLVCLVTVLTTGCSGADHPAPGPRSPGTGRFDVSLEDGRKIPVHYVVGDGGTGGGERSGGATPPTLIVVMHGVRRNAADYRGTWTPLVRGHDAIVVAPEFSDRQFPGVAQYNLGGVRAGESADPSGAFAAMPALLDGIDDHFGLPRDTPYDLFGHSAGAQFVHRYVEFADTSRLRQAVAANAGWYTMPDEHSTFPYGFGDTSGSRPARQLFSTRLTLLLGGDDVEDENLRTRPEAMRQGATRLERGFSFFVRARTAAAAAGVSSVWGLRVVPGVGHDQESMAAAAAPVLLGS